MDERIIPIGEYLAEFNNYLPFIEIGRIKKFYK